MEAEAAAGKQEIVVAFALLLERAHQLVRDLRDSHSPTRRIMPEPEEMARSAQNWLNDYDDLMRGGDK